MKGETLGDTCGSSFEKCRFFFKNVLLEILVIAGEI